MTMPSFIMGFREGLEAFLLIAITLKYITSINQGHLKNKVIKEMNEKDLQDRLKQTRTELFKLNVESKKGTLRKESGKLKPLRKDIARMMTRLNKLKKI